MPDDWADATKEGAKTAGKIVDATREFGHFIAPIVKSPLENAIGIVSDRLSYMRWERQQRLMERARLFMSSQGVDQPTRPVPLNIAIPILQAASMEEDDDLQDTWARLLVNALNERSGVEVKHVFVSMLKDMTPIEVIILNILYYEFDHDFYSSMHVEDLKKKINSSACAVKEIPEEELMVALWNLARLGCILRDNQWIGGDGVYQFFFTSLGKCFVRSCTFLRND